MRRLDQVGELVQHQVFDGARRLRGEAAVENDVARARAACPPLAFHGTDADAGGADAEPLLPLRDERVEAALEFAALEAFEVPLDFGGIVRVAGVNDEAGWRLVGRGFDGGRLRPAGGASPSNSCTARGTRCSSSSTSSTPAGAAGPLDPPAATIKAMLDLSDSGADSSHAFAALDATLGVTRLRAGRPRRAPLGVRSGADLPSRGRQAVDAG